MEPNLESNNYYEILGVESSCGLKEIKNAYRTLAKKYHPDKSSSKDTQKKFVAISSAYEVLSSENTRSNYDKSLESNSFSFDYTASNLSKDLEYWADFFEDVFTNIKGEDVNVYCRLTLEELKVGCTKIITLNSGKISIKVKPESKPNSILKVAGKGNTTPECSIPGDLFIKLIPKPHDIFKLSEEGNIFYIQKLFYQDLILGKSCIIPTLTSKVKISIPPYTSIDQEFRLRGQGINGKDLIIKLKLVTPTDLSKKEVELIKSLNSYTNLKSR